MTNVLKQLKCPVQSAIRTLFLGSQAQMQISLYYYRKSPDIFRNNALLPEIAQTSKKG